MFKVLTVTLETASQAINNVAKPCFDQLDLYQMTFYIFRHDQKFKYLKLKFYLLDSPLDLWSLKMTIPPFVFHTIFLRLKYWVNILVFSDRIRRIFFFWGFSFNEWCIQRKLVDGTRDILVQMLILFNRVATPVLNLRIVLADGRSKEYMFYQKMALLLN